MDTSFCVVSTTNKELTKIQRIEKIKAVCDGMETSYRTDYPHIVRLCRSCISDICKELTERVNWETSRYKKYTVLHDQIVNGTYPNDYDANFVEDLEIQITDAKYLYAKYHSMYKDFIKKKLYTKACIICNS